MIYNSRLLSCPVVRSATIADAEEMAELVIHSNSKFINSVFKNDHEGGKEVLKTQFEQYNDGLYILTEADTIIGVMKLHLPDELIGHTISFIQLIKILGLRKGIRAGILLSHWDEYKLSPEEAYIEYLYVHHEWGNFNVVDILLERAFEEAYKAGATYITHFIPVNNYLAMSQFEDHGFVMRRRTRSPLAKLMGTPYSAWYKATYSLRNVPITVKEYVVDKLGTMRKMWHQRRREIFAALRITIAMTIIPIVAGTLAYVRGFPLAATGWLILGLIHLIGTRMYLKGSTVASYGLVIAMMSEGINLLSRAIATESWFDRSWLLPLSLVAFWIASVLLRNPRANYSVQLTAA